ncbi:MAG: alpha/beta hydrolase fold domain-containing protein, partial [Verrucomicrobiota bacterium]
FLPEYRVASRHQTTPRECVADGKSAIRWVRQNAARLGVDPEKIIAGGGSAGGHVAATTGICEGFDEETEDLSISSRPAALVLFNPVYDNGPDGYGHSRAKTWFPAISPAHNLSDDDPPTVVFLGMEDDLIPVETAIKFQSEMMTHSLRSDLHLYESQPHGFFNRGKTSGHLGFIDTLTKTDRFLAEIGYLTGEPNHAAIAEIANAESKSQ